ncbi:MAG: radical SAM protein [Lachnospiraceae bacterium]|nr:radical SAM protein [Lachnospiraceae bacterium]
MNRLSENKLKYHVDRLLDIKEKGETYPVHITIGLTEYCCHKCVFCHSEFATSDTTRNATMQREQLISFLKEAYECGVKSVTLVGSGEPLLHPEIEEILRDIKNIGLEIGIFTNGSKAKGTLLNTIIDTCTFVRFSINAGDSKEHEKVHGVVGDFENIVSNVSEMVKKKKEKNLKFPTIGTQMVFYEGNYRSMVKAAKMWGEIGVDYFEIKPVIAGEGNQVDKTVFPAKDKEEVHKLMDEAKQYETNTYNVYTKYNQYIVTQDTNNRQYTKCYGSLLDMNLWADGNIFVCANLEHERYIIGNIYKNTFKEIWNGEQKKKIRQSINLKACPKGCRCHFMNEYIWDYLHPDKEIHPNFV